MAERNVEETVKMTKEEKNAQIRLNEDDILAGLIKAASYKIDAEETVPIKIVRQGETVVEFRMRPLSEEEYLECKKRNTTYKRNKQLGTRVAESVNAARYRSELIYTATIDADKEAIWNNKKAWNALGVLNGIDLIDVVLMAGEKDAILETLEELSGYQPSVEDTAKN